MTERIPEQLARLRQEIDALPKDHETARSQLAEIVTDIESELDPGLQSNPNLLDKIRRAIGDFEVEHPRATAILNDISHKLASMGI